MITGVETAGLVLAALPLIISALENYNNGLKPLKDFVNYQSLIKELAGSLRTQFTLLQSTCERLLITLPISSVELACLLHEPACSAWREQSLVQHLEKRLQNYYATFLHILENLSDALQKLASTVGYSVQGLPLLDYTKKPKRYWKRLRTCLAHQQHDALVSRMQLANDNLRSLVDDSLQTELPRTERRNQKASSRHVRDCADRLHRALRSRWLCSCDSAHYAELRLQQRAWDQPPSFRVTFPITSNTSREAPTTWHETEIKTFPDSVAGFSNTSTKATPISESTVTAENIPQRPSSGARKSSLLKFNEHFRTKEKKSVVWAAATPAVQAANLHLADLKAAQEQTEVEQDPEDIQDFCSVLRCIRHHSSCSVIGRFVHDRSQYEVVSISQQCNGNTNISTFHDILLSHGKGSLTTGCSGSPLLARGDRLKLAVILASTALQLQTTPWLDTEWSGKDIYFRQGVLDSPYVSSVLAESAIPSARALKADLGPIRNRSIFALGILLLEISLKKPFEHLKSSKLPQGPQQPHNEFEDLLVASRLFGDLADEEGKCSGYYSATQACIFGNFGSKARDLDLASDSFRQAVYEDVILPLERDLEYCCGGPGV